MASRGFTLIEVLMTGVVIAVLASMALPGYRKTAERQYWQAAQDILLAIYAGEQARFELNDRTSFFGPLSPCDGDSACLASWRDNIFVDDPNGSARLPVTFTVAASGTGSGATFTATADRGDGQCLSIDQLGSVTLSSTAPSCTSSWGMP